MNVMEIIEACGVVPVLTLDNPKTAPLITDALKRGGLPLVEVTFRSETAASALAAVRKERPDILAGAGTILTLEQLQQAKDADAQFVVTPGFNPVIVDACIEAGIPVVPGCVTPTEIEMALGRGLRVLKFFPSEAMGGLKTMKQLTGPYSMIRFIPTGGISPDNLGEYLAAPFIVAAGGSFVAPKKLMESEAYDEIEAICRNVSEIVKNRAAK